MTIDADDLLLFARVVEAGSLSAAALRLDWPKSTVSRRLSGLEQRLGERLLQRSTRRLSLTEFGQGVLEHARQVAVEVEAAQALAAHRQVVPSGRLRVSMAGDLATFLMADLVADFLVRHPLITLELDLSPRRVDLIAENIDVAIRAGELPADSSLAARRLVDFTGALYAAPSWVDRREPVVDPDQLPLLDGLVLSRDGADPRPWKLSETATARTWTGRPRVHAAANSPHLLGQLATAGLGITALPDLYAAEAVADGRLVRVLPGWQTELATVWAVFPERRLMPARTRAFIDAMVAGLAQRCRAHGCAGAVDPSAGSSREPAPALA
ncbi:LysR family transcriptional regulator [Leptothrix discophora]|uniref:LysR family transcriptional regulator n=1 Tax=Leptothrix discophora TaxID=89 RepID=A0ABT9FYS9_LEPDI|nr:LysR family transcriptional regulator [Leptothrix discophora]MDP4299380.1 LysR family transcriptional regulator [Leptothrix discophora]